MGLKVKLFKNAKCSKWIFPERVEVLISQSSKGPVAEWLGKALQKLLQRFESARDLWITLQKNAKTC